MQTWPSSETHHASSFFIALLIKRGLGVWPVALGCSQSLLHVGQSGPPLLLKGLRPRCPGVWRWWGSKERYRKMARLAGWTKCIWGDYDDEDEDDEEEEMDA